MMFAEVSPKEKPSEIWGAFQSFAEPETLKPATRLRSRYTFRCAQANKLKWRKLCPCLASQCCTSLLRLLLLSGFSESSVFTEFDAAFLGNRAGMHAA